MTTSPPSLEATSSSDVLRSFDGPGGPEIQLGLDRIKMVLQRLGNPHLSMSPTTHIAGTNGKGSVAAYLRALMEAAGMRVHSFNSPHLLSIHDGILLGGEPVTEEKLLKALARVQQQNLDRLLTSFEALTVAAFLLMSEDPADHVVLEAGLGGRDDATNVLLKPAATVLTPVGFDHQEFLGDSLTAIAQHKAGIFRANVPVIVAPQSEEVRNVVEIEAAKLNAPLYMHNEAWSVFEQHGRMVFQDDTGLLDLSLPPLSGRFQIENAGTALKAFRCIAPEAGDDLKTIEAGIASAHWPGRLQRLTRGPLCDLFSPPSELWLDGGHNTHAAQALSQALADMDERSPLPTHLIIGMRKNKDLDGFLAPFRGLVRSVQSVALPDTVPCHSPQDIASAALDQGFAVEVAGTTDKAVANLTKDAAQPKRMLICGSLLLAGQVLAENG